MRIAVIGRVLNEDDIIEAFVRHHLAYAERILLLDNGSTDRTLEILRALRAEGAPLTVMQSKAVFFNEREYNTLLYRIADHAFKPDWILPLDVDEFVDTRQASLHDCLAAVPPEVQAARFTLWNYFADGLDTTDLLVPRRNVMRDATNRQVPKCAIRGGFSEQIAVLPGNHETLINGELASPTDVPDVPLAHYPVRHPVQFVLKAAMGRLKVLATGAPSIEAGHSGHYTHMLEALIRNPAEIFGDARRMAGVLPDFPLVEDPIRYAGSDLRYTEPADVIVKSLRSLATFASDLAASHGRLLDQHPEARAKLYEAAVQAEVLLT